MFSFNYSQRVWHLLKFVRRGRPGVKLWEMSSCCSSSSSKKSWGCIISNWIGTKFNRIVLEVNAHRSTEILYLTSHFQDGGHDIIVCKKCTLTCIVRPAPAAASASCLLAILYTDPGSMVSSVFVLVTYIATAVGETLYYLGVLLVFLLCVCWQKICTTLFRLQSSYNAEWSRWQRSSQNSGAGSQLPPRLFPLWGMNVMVSGGLVVRYITWKVYWLVD